MSTAKKISITVVVNGQPTVVDAIGDASLSTIIPDALRQTENSGQPPENWELRGRRWDASRPGQEDRRLWLSSQGSPVPKS